MTMLPDNRMRRVWVLAALTFVGITIAIWTLNHEANEAKTLAQANEAAISTLASALEAEQQAAVEEGREPAGPSAEELIGNLDIDQRVADQVAEVIDDLGGIRGPPGPAGAEGPPPSQESVRVAVSLYCSVDDRCRGARGRQGQPGEQGVSGPAPTPEQVAEAVATFCSEDSCVGPEGPQGPGPSEGQIVSAVLTFCNENDCMGPQGPRGPGPTETQVREAVARFCADGACVGPRGPQGERGPRGTSITDVRFVGSHPGRCRMVLDLSDGTTVSSSVPSQLCRN